MEGESIRLVVGLGNPGERYAGTRHNVGFLAVDKFLGEFGNGWSEAAAGDGLAGRATLPGSRDVWVVKPHTFMNVSGEMVAAFARYYKIPPAAVMVVADDFNLPLGRIRIRVKGSAGGQKGLDSILHYFGSQQIPRIRLGIGPVPDQRDPADFVLGKFRSGEREACEDMTLRASKAILACCEGGLRTAMNAFNGSGE